MNTTHNLLSNLEITYDNIIKKMNSQENKIVTLFNNTDNQLKLMMSLCKME